MTRALILQTLRELVRSRAPLVVVAWLGLSALVAPTLASLVMGQASRGVTDLLLTSLWLLGCALSVATAQSTAHHDRSALGLFVASGADPARWALARHLGLLLCAASIGLTGAAGWSLIARVNGIALPQILPAWTLLVVLEWSLIGATTWLLRLYLRPLPAGASVVALWMVSHLEGPYAALAETRQGWLPIVHGVVWTVLPNLHRLDLSAHLAHRTSPEPLAVAGAALYGLAWWGAVCLISAAAARTRDWT